MFRDEMEIVSANHRQRGGVLRADARSDDARTMLRRVGDKLPDRRPRRALATIFRHDRISDLDHFLGIGLPMEPGIPHDGLRRPAIDRPGKPWGHGRIGPDLIQPVPPEAATEQKVVRKL